MTTPRDNEPFRSLIDPSANDVHLTDQEVGDGTWTPDANKHLSDCPVCQQRVDAAANDDDDDADDEALFAELADLPLPATPNEWAAIRPSAEVLSLAYATGGDGDVSPGELWTARWQTSVAMVFIVAVDGWRVTAAPATTDVHLADEYTLIIDAVSSPLEQPLGIWLRQPATLPMFVLERLLAPLPHVAGRSSASAALEITRAGRRLVAPPDDLPVGDPLVEHDFERLAMLDTLTLLMADLAAATHAIDEVTGPIDGETEGDRIDGGDTIDLQQHLEAAGLDPRTLSERTGLSLVELLRIKRTGEVSHAQAVALADVLDLTVAMLYSTPDIPDELILAVSRPSLRARRRDWTLAHHSDTFEDNPTPLIRAALEPMAARSIARTPTESSETSGRSATQRYWDDRVGLTLAGA